MQWKNDTQNKQKSLTIGIINDKIIMLYFRFLCEQISKTYNLKIGGEI